jgi:SAM-dependent methyltransferase
MKGPDVAATSDRWKAAQQYEKGYWASVARKISEGSAAQLDWYRSRADRLVRRLAALGFADITTGNARVLEVGSGPIGLVTFFPGRERISVDPLHGFYRTEPTLSTLRDPAVDYREGSGEQIPCESGWCDLLVIENCIDHVHNVHGVMADLNRVLKPGGVLYLTVNSRTRLGYYVHRLLSRLQIDRGHPHTFTLSRAAALLRQHGFEIVEQHAGSALKVHLEDLRGPGMRSRLKALAGVSEFVLTFVATKSGGRTPGGAH